MSAIEWTDKTLNVSIGCSRVSAGCENCYAERLASRGLVAEHEGTTTRGPKGPRWNGAINLVPERILWPFRWKKPRRIFVNSMSDLFHGSIPDEFLDQVFAMFALNRRHTFQVLTKRSRRMREYLSAPGRERAIFEEACGMAGEERRRSGREAEGTIWADGVGVLQKMPWPLKNVWIGVSGENQDAMIERVEDLQRTPAAKRFVSLEPLIDRIQIGAFYRSSEDYLSGFYYEIDPEGSIPGLDWVIVGGESGPGARPCNVEWIRSIREQCRAASVPVFVKQYGARPFVYGEHEPAGCNCREANCEHEPQFPRVEWLHLKNRKGADPSEWSDDLRVQQFPDEEGESC